MKDSLLYTQNNLDIEDIILYKFPNRYVQRVTDISWTSLYRHTLSASPIWGFPQSNEWAIK